MTQPSPSRRRSGPRTDGRAGLSPESREARVAIVMAEASETRKWSPLKPVLTLIAVLMAVGLVVQVTMSFMAYRQLRARPAPEIGTPVADRAYLQEIYQTYGIRAASREEAELLLADLRRKEQAEQSEQRKAREQQDQARRQQQFEDESRRIGAQVADRLGRAEREAEYRRQEELRRKEEQERTAQQAENARIEREKARWRSVGSGSSGYSGGNGE